MRRIVVTGLGMITPVGHDVEQTWSAILEGRSGIAPIRRFDASAFSSRIGAEVRDFDLRPYLSSKEARRSDDFVHFGIAAAVQAIEDSGLEIDPGNAETNRHRDRFGYRGTVRHREGASRLRRWRPEKDLSVLRSRQHHQHDRGQPVDPIRHQGPELRNRHRVLHRNPQHRRCGSDDRTGRRGRHGGRRFRDGDFAHGARGVRVGAGTLDKERRAAASQPPLGPGPWTDSCLATGPG